MDEQTMPEQHLSEELLQQITGGCQACHNDHVSMRNHDIFYRAHSESAHLAFDNDDDDQYEAHTNAAFFHAEKSSEALRKIVQRATTPGHVMTPEPQRPPGRRWIMS